MSMCSLFGLIDFKGVLNLYVNEPVTASEEE